MAGGPIERGSDSAMARLWHEAGRGPRDSAETRVREAPDLRIREWR
jgi:hypothetical protein